MPRLGLVGAPGWFLVLKENQQATFGRCLRNNTHPGGWVGLSLVELGWLSSVWKKSRLFLIA